MKAIGYFRVLPNIEQGVQSPLVEQEECFSRFCQDHAYEQTNTFVDTDSGAKVSENQYQHMLHYIRQQGDNLLVVVKNLHHIHPNPQETVRCLLELESLGASVLSTDEALDDPLVAALQIWSAQRHGEERGDRVREGMRVRAIHGKGLGKPPFGYRIGGDQKLEIVPEEADTVSLIYKLYLQQHMGVRLIARHLNEQGITTRKGGRWSIVGIRDILRNRAYLGTYSRLGVKVPDSHTPIISSHVFGRVQEQLSAKPRRREYIRRPPLLLAGLAYCGYCGNKMIGVNRNQTWTRHRDGGKSKGEYRYYQCQSRANQGVCRYHTKRAEDLERAVLAVLKRFSSPDEREQLVKQYTPTTDQKTAERPDLIKKLKAINRRFRRCLEEAAQDPISPEELRAVGGDLVRERQLLEQRLILLEAEASGEITAEQRRAYNLEALENLQDRWESMTLQARRDLLQCMIERIMVYDDHIEPLLRL
jgi:site-specific DNA recombinase